MCYTSKKNAQQLYLNSLMQDGSMSAHFSAHVYTRQRVLCISISSGVLLKMFPRVYGSPVRDSCTVHMCSPWEGFFKTSVCSRDSPDSWYKYFFTFFLLIPYGRTNRPLRTIMSSMQSVQGISLPWTPGTSAYRPHYSFIPLVHTDTLEDILQKTYNETHTWKLSGRLEEADMTPGTLLLTAVINDTCIYKDTVLVCQDAIDRGMFHCILVLVFSLKEMEPILHQALHKT